VKRRIAILPGDGVGPEVVAEAVRAIGKVPGLDYVFEEFSVGAGEYLRSGSPLPEETYQRILEFDAVLLGAMGLPGVRWPSGIEMTPQLDLRERMDLYCGLRPIRLYHASHSPLKGRRAGEINLMIVRENTEGLFHSRLVPLDREADYAEDRMRITRRGAERVCRSAFEQARRRSGRVALVDKANVLPSMAYFRMIFDEVAEANPDIEAGRIYVDAMALYLVQCPERFDVLVTENMFGDILSDLAAGLVGGMGMAPSADIGELYGVFQPSHGSAPDIAGQGIANPVATILSAAMMLEWLGAPVEREGAQKIRRAVETVLSREGAGTRDLGGRMSTSELGRLISEAIQ
jgi:3-isopropylmalate dehydrogenase